MKDVRTQTMSQWWTENLRFFQYFSKRPTCLIFSSPKLRPKFKSAEEYSIRIRISILVYLITLADDNVYPVLEYNFQSFLFFFFFRYSTYLFFLQVFPPPLAPLVDLRSSLTSVSLFDTRWYFVWNFVDKMLPGNCICVRVFFFSFVEFPQLIL